MPVAWPMCQYLQSQLLLTILRKVTQITTQSMQGTVFEFSHSVQEYIEIKGSYLDQILPQHEILYPINKKKYIQWDPPWGISILTDFRPMGYKL